MTGITLGGRLETYMATPYDGREADRLYRAYLDGDDSLKSAVYEAFLPAISKVGPAMREGPRGPDLYDKEDVRQMLAIFLIDLIDREHRLPFALRRRLGAAFIVRQLFLRCKDFYAQSFRENKTKHLDFQGREVPIVVWSNHKNILDKIFLEETVYALPELVRDTTRLGGRLKDAVYWVCVRVIEDRETPDHDEMGFWFDIGSNRLRFFVRDHSLIRLRIALQKLREEHPHVVERTSEVREFVSWFSPELL